MPKPKRVFPTAPPPQLAREVKTYRWPGSAAIVRQIGANVFLPMLSAPIDGKECFILEPEAPSCFTLQEAVAWMEARKEQAKNRVVEADKGPPLYVPPGRGKIQA